MIQQYQGDYDISKSVQVMSVIRTTLEIKGEGTKENPYRKITQFWTLDGYLLAEVDSMEQK